MTSRKLNSLKRACYKLCRMDINYIITIKENTLSYDNLNNILDRIRLALNCNVSTRNIKNKAESRCQSDGLTLKTGLANITRSKKP